MGESSDFGNMESDVIFKTLQQDVGLWPVGGLCTIKVLYKKLCWLSVKTSKTGDGAVASF